MNGIVVEIKNKDAVVLSDNGSVIKVKNNNYQIGDEVEVKNDKKLKVRFIAVAASFAIAFTVAGGAAYAYTTPYSYVSLDVNPSIEYSVNAFHRVIDVNGVNDDGKNIINNINVKHKSIDEAIKDTVSEITEKGYIKDGEDSEIIIATSSNNEAKTNKLADELKVDVENVISENNLVADVEVFSVGKERVLEAKALGVTPGKLNLVEKLQKSSENPDEILIGEWLGKPVKEIINATKSKGEEGITRTEKAINRNRQQGEISNSKNVVGKETKNTNEIKSNNIVEEKATNTNFTAYEENKASSESKSQSFRDNIEIKNKKSK